MKLEQLLNIVKENVELERKIFEFIDNYEGSGFGGKCGIFAIELNHYLGGIGEYYGAINKQIWELGEQWIGHVALKVGDSLYDSDGKIRDIEAFKAWGQVDEEGNEAELYNLTPEECYESEIINLSSLWGDRVEELIRTNTSCE